MGERYFRASIGALLAQALAASGLHPEALRIASEVEAIAAEDDVEAQAIWRTARAKAIASQGDVEEALRLTEQAVEILTPTDALIWKADALVDRAMVLVQADRTESALAALDGARELYRLKGAALPLRRADALRAGVELLAPGARPGKPAHLAKPVLVSHRSSRRSLPG